MKLILSFLRFRRTALLSNFSIFREQNDSGLSVVGEDRSLWYSSYVPLTVSLPQCRWWLYRLCPRINLFRFRSNYSLRFALRIRSRHQSGRLRVPLGRKYNFLSCFVLFVQEFFRRNSCLLLFERTKADLGLYSSTVQEASKGNVGPSPKIRCTRDGLVYRFDFCFRFRCSDRVRIFHSSFTLSSC